MSHARDPAWGNDVGTGTFARRVRALLAHRSVTIAWLAEATNIEASFLSRLLAEREETRREPQLEHVFAIARALGLSPFQLVMGTDAVHVLGQWVPRRELEAEVERRLEAQQGVLKREGDLAGLRAQLEQLRSEMNMLAHDTANAESEARSLRMQRAALLAERDVARAQRDEAVRERDEIAQQLQGLRSRLEAMQRTGAGALFGAVFGGLFGGAQGASIGALVGAGVMSGPTTPVVNTAPIPAGSPPIPAGPPPRIGPMQQSTPAREIPIAPMPVGTVTAPAAPLESMREALNRSATTRGKSSGATNTKRRGTR